MADSNGGLYNRDLKLSKKAFIPNTLNNYK
jgi:hypothetical protein